MPTLATKAYTSFISFSTNGSTYTKVTQTVDVGGPSPEVGDINVTNNDSANNTKEYIPGLIEPGDYEFQIIYDKTQCNTLYTMFDAATVYYWQVTFPDSAKWKFQGYMKGFGTEGQTDDGVLTNTMTIKVTGKPTFHTS